MHMKGPDAIEFHEKSSPSTLQKARETYRQFPFASLPINALGRLDDFLGLHALNRYFVQKSGWHVRGLDATTLGLRTKRGQGCAYSGVRVRTE